MIISDTPIISIGSLLKAASKKLMWPKIRVPVETGNFKFSLSSKTRDSIVVRHNDNYICSISENRSRLRDNNADEPDTAEMHYCLEYRYFWARGVSVPAAVREDLSELLDNKELVEKLAATGRETGVCCFCALLLTDPRSIFAGYGPICAAHYGLPWGEDGQPAPTSQLPLPDIGL